ncbi:uncharacterized protein CIMG_04517 [Coccidioides immitis RS]|uniref:Uncharacterized protein n=1 Tax=Coccidioides immitis (strain RS) TaxID=246410 RepID=A0A0E1RY80_COCIM|nr:uncharacterized protein CIMG_04517 [Coccidioides immitis RS]EAS33493.1 hypothetical protein CIMG_04517 [Coccidioides immitis RS]
MDISQSVLPTVSVDRPHLKSHKVLPRKRDVTHDVELTSSNDSDGPRADSPLLNGFIFPQPAPTLPLTPPSLTLESKKQSPLTLPIDASQPQTSDSTNATPTRQANILTPDITPPRSAPDGRKRPAQYRNFTSMSSKAESFKTAREVLSSDDDLEGINGAGISALPPPKSLLPLPLVSYDTVGSPGHHSSLGSQESALRTKKENESACSRRFDAFDRDRKEHGPDKADLPRARNQRQNRDIVNGNKTSPGMKSWEESRQGLESQTNRERPLRERLKEGKGVVTSASIEKFAKDIGWQVPEDRDKHSCRLSAVSASSTIEAIIIDSPPRKKQTLRHTGKAESLRSVSSPASHSNRDMSRGLEQGRRLVRKNARITDQDRSSIMSDMSLALTTAYPKPKEAEEIIPVVVIPQRRSSLRSSTCGSREHSRTRTIVENRRPTTAPEGKNSSHAFFDFPRRRRTMSESFPHPRRSSDTARRAITSRPRIPARRSSLSAPTSRTASRTTSLTSDNLQQYQIAQDTQSFAHQKSQEGQENVRILDPVALKIEQSVPKDVNTQDNTENRLCVDSHYNDSLLQTPSLPKTPFQHSIQSLSPGPIEISEARAIPFFVHNNKSLLLVEQYTQPESRAVQTLQTSPTDLEVTLIDTHTSIMEPQLQAACINSPLRNPRPPPKPPALKVIPPTPLEISKHRPNHLPSSSTESSNGLARRWESLRRTFSTKQYSNTGELGQPVHKFRNRKAGKDIDSKLHPFWRPREFWEDFKDSDTDGESVQRMPISQNVRQAGDVYIGNSLGIPQKRIFQGPLTLIRRVSNRSRLRAPRRRNDSHTSIISTTLPLSDRPAHDRALPYFLSFSEMQNWIARTKRRKARERLEAKRNKLRQMINMKATVNPSSVESDYPQPTRSAFDS